jgi:diguanylate cyclase (GGDEF)-like protein
MPYDPLTLWLLIVFVIVLTSGILLLTWATTPGSDVLVYWAGALLFSGLGIAGVAARGYIPNFVSIELANAAAFLGGGLMWVGFRRFDRRPLNLPVIFIAPAVWIAACQLPLFAQSTGNRVVLASILMMAFMLASIRELRRGAEERIVARTIAIVALSIQFFILASRLIVVQTMDLDRVFILRTDPVFAWYGLASLAFIMVMAFTMIAMVRERRELTYKQASMIDDLTGLLNRRGFMGSAVRACAPGRPFAVLALDLDRFKQVNDTFGHHFGDLYLQTVVDRFRSRLRETDTLARTGGDEFTAVLTDLKTVEGASYVAKELLATLKNPLLIEGCSIEAGASIGIAVFPDDADNAEALRRGADQAMYWAKSRGRNRHECFAGDARDTLDIEEQMRIALEEGKFEIFYQPLFRPDRSIEAMEALLRFRHPRLGMVPPSRFIPVAEECGLIVAIGDWVLQQVCHQIGAWQKDGLQARVAVNVSALQFGRADFASCVSQALARTGVDPSCIELELTESLVMSNVQESSRQMTKLKHLGVRMSVDDFGTGYSSLSYLHELPIDTLKIDRSFIEKVSEPNGTRPIVEAVVSLAKSLHMRTVAEGVETQEQLAVVHAVGCDLVQGFLLSKPVPTALIPDLLRKAQACHPGANPDSFINARIC